MISRRSRNGAGPRATAPPVVTDDPPVADANVFFKTAPLALDVTAHVLEKQEPVVIHEFVVSTVVRRASEITAGTAFTT